MTDTQFRLIVAALGIIALLPAILPYYIMLIKDWKRDHIPRKFLETEMKDWHRTTQYHEFIEELLKSWDEYCDEYL